MDLRLTNLRSDYKLIYKVQPVTAMRIATLIEFVKISHEYEKIPFKHGKKIKLIALCQGLEISLRTLFRWRCAYIKNGFIGLTPRKALGRKAQNLSEVEKFLIKEMRTKYRWGAEVIQAHLKHDHSVKLTKYKIERYLYLSNLREEYPVTTKKRKLRKTKAHKTVVKIHNPGEHTQIDTKHQPHILSNGKKCYVFNFVDHASNWSFKKAYSSISPKSTIDFMNKLIAICPFKIERIQTDNGTEYTYKFYKAHADIIKVHPLTIFCDRNKINHKLIPPGEKELQGLVERSHRQDDQELCLRIEPIEIEEFNRSIQEYYTERNEQRRFKKLDWKTPNEWLQDYRLTQRALNFGHNFKLINELRNLVPNQKSDDLPKSSEQVTIAKIDNGINTSKDKEKSDDKLNIKKVA